MLLPEYWCWSLNAARILTIIIIAKQPSRRCQSQTVTVFLTVENSPEPVLNGEFGEVSAPVFVDGVACDGTELSIESCITSARVGFITDSCACDGCAEDLGVRCPGIKTIYY